MKVSTYALLIAVILIGLVLAGCPNREQNVEVETEEPVVADARQVDVALGEWYVRLDPETIDAGEVQFNIVNEGDVVHSFEIEGNGIEEVSRNLSAGETTTMTVTLPAGTYDAYCPIGDHAARGMRTDFVVTE